jgi:hypothetical protein
MEDGLSARARNVFRSIAFMVFMVTSAYLVLELVIALSAQGEPTGAVAPFTGAELVYPNWYQAPEFLDAVSVALVAYPVAALFYGIGMFAGWAGRMNAPPPTRLPPELPAPESATAAKDAPVSAARTTEDVCVISADRRIQQIAPFTASLFGLTPRVMVGQSLEVFLSPVDLPKLDALIAAAYADRPRAFATTVGILLPDAVVAPVDITCSASVDGGVTGPGTAILTVRPFSERGRLDDQLAALWY